MSEQTHNEQNELPMDDLQSELSAAFEADGMEVAPAYRAPAPAEQAAPDTPPAPEGKSTEGGEQPASVEGGDSETPQPFNPDTLPPELVPAWKQMQAAFTPRLQEAADLKKQLEALGPLEDIQEAVELYGRLSDPNNWSQLHQELTEAMEQAGLTPQEARDAVNQAASEVAAATPDQFKDDPELAALYAEVQRSQQAQATLQARLDALDANTAAQREAEEAERAHQAHLLNMQRQAVAIREANKHYTDDDLGAVVRLGSHFNDDLMQAQAYLEEYFSSRLDRWLQSKEGSLAPSLQPHSGAGVESTPAPADSDTIRGVREAAEAEVRALMDAGEIAFE